MAGGTFTAFNKVRPGAYINTISAQPKKAAANRGTVLLINGISYGWGADGVVEINADTDLKKALGVSFDDEKAATITEALKGAVTVKLININGGNKASADTGLGVAVTAKHAGVKGNDLIIDIIQDATNKDNVIIKTIFGTSVVDTQVVAAAKPQALQANKYVDFKVTGDKLTVNGEKTVQLAGGTNQDATNMDIVGERLAAALQTEQYQVVTTAGYEQGAPIHKLAAQLVTDLRNKQGYKVTIVVPYDGTKYDNEAVTVVANGVVDSNYKVLPSTIVAAWYAGQSAAVPFNKSLTYAKYQGAKAVAPVKANDDIIDDLNAGHVVFTQRRNGDVVVEKDVNSLVTFTDQKGEQFRNNRELRALDEIANHVNEIFEDGYIGQVTNNEDGRSLLKASLIAYFKELSANNVIGDFDNADLFIAKGEDDESVVINYAITPLNSMEKLYNTITVTR